MTALSEIIEKGNVEDGFKKDARTELAKYKAVVKAAQKLAETHEDSGYTWGDTETPSQVVHNEQRRDEALEQLLLKIYDLFVFTKGAS